MITPPVGKSGPGICFINSLILISLSPRRAKVPSLISPKLCGGIANDNSQSSNNSDDMSQISNDMDDEIPF